MIREIEAIYENGKLRPLEPLPLAENQHVKVTVSDISADPLEEMIDHTYLEYARRVVAAASHIPTHDEVQRMTAKDPTSWSDAIIAQREERF